MEQRSKTNQIVKTSLAVITAFVITGCNSSQPNVVKEYPVWYNKVQQDSAIFYYGTADGQNKNDAINNALNQIASKVSVTIESNFESSSFVDNQTLNEFSKSEVRNKVSKINFNNYTILKEKNLGQGYVVSLRVNRLDLAQNMEDKINNTLVSLSNQLNANYKNIVYKLKNYSKATKSLKDLSQEIFLLSSINKTAETKPYLDKIHKLEKKITKFKNSVTFYVKGDGDYSKVCRDLITQKGYKISSYHPNLSVNISVNKTKVTSMGYKIAKGVVNIKVIDNKNNSVVGEKRFMVGGKSLSSFKQANEFMLNLFKQKLQKEKILSNLLGV